jgi:hypothetical protein
MKRDMMCLCLGVGDNLPMKGHGMVCSYIHDAEWEVPLHKIITRIHIPAYAFLLVKPSLKPYIQAHTNRAVVRGIPLYDAHGQLMSKMIAQHELFIDYQELGEKLGIPNLGTEILKPRDTVMVLAGSELGTEIFHNYRHEGIHADPVYDRYAIASGSYTIGASKNYATNALFFADHAATYTGNLTGTIQTNVTETAVSSTSSAMAGHTLTHTSDTDPLGVFGSGRIISLNAATDLISWYRILCTSASAANVNISKLNYKMIATGATNYQSIMYHVPASSGIVINMSGCLFDCNGRAFRTVILGGTGVVYKVFNCIACNGYAPNANQYTEGFVFASTAAGFLFENCTAYNFIGIAGNNSWPTAGQGLVSGIDVSNCPGTIRNCASFGCSTHNGVNFVDYIYYTGSAFADGLGTTITATKCASSDTTGSEAALRDLSSAEFVSVTIADANFLRAAANRKLWNSGAALSITANNVGVRGNARPWMPSTYSIGADEFARLNKGTVPAGIF